MRRLFEVRGFKPDPARDVQEEMDLHLEMETERLMARGLGEEEARREAEALFGERRRVESEAVREATAQWRTEWWKGWVEALGRDLLYALRRLGRSRRFTAVAILTLGVGIGATSVLFTVVHSVLLSPLPFKESERLFFAWETREGGSRDTPVSPLNFKEWREAGRAVGEMAAVRPWPYNLTGLELPERLNGAQVSSGLLSLFRVAPFLGREFAPVEEHAGADRVCMVSHDFWLQRLGGDRDLASIRLILDGESCDVVGVLPSRFSIPGFGPLPVLTPLPLDPADPGYGSNHNAQVFVRLNAETPREQADRQLHAVAERQQKTYPEWNDGIGARLQPARERIVQAFSQSLWMLFGSVALVLLIACCNIAGLFLARGVESEGEMAVRVALGAGRSRLVRLVLSEAVVVGLAAGLLGLGVCQFGIHGIQRWAPAGTPRLAEVTVGFPVLAFVLGLSVGASLFLGLLPSLHASRVDIQNMLKAGGRTLGLGRRHGIQRVLVVGQICVATVLLIGSGLLLRSFVKLQNVDPGVDVEGRTALRVSLPRSSYPGRDRVTDFLHRLQARLVGIPGVETVGSSVGLPFQGPMWRKLMTLEDHPAASLPEVPVVDLSIVTAGWLETLGIPLVRGRALLESDADGAPLVALVNEAFVRAHLPDQDPLGRRLRLAAPDHLLPAGDENEAPWYTIVGVVGDVRRWSLAAEAAPEVYIQQRQDRDVAREFFVVAHTDLPAETLLEPMRQAVRAVDPNQPVAWVRTMGSMHATMMAQPRFSAVLVSAFGVTALFLSLIGVYGLVANAVAARRREIGLRLALGADPGSVLKQFVGRGALDCILGIALGLLLSAVLGRVMTSQLFGVEALDPVTYSLVVLLVPSVAVVAAALPSRRAAKMGPTAALRAD